MVWRAYYTLKDAADELSREFNDTYTPADLVHYGAIGLTTLCLSGLDNQYSFFEIEYADMFNPEGIIEEWRSLFSGVFVPVDEYQMRKIEAGNQAKLKTADFLKSKDGEIITPMYHEPDPYEFTARTFHVIPLDVVQDIPKDADIEKSRIFTETNFILFEAHDLYILQSDLKQLKNTIREKITGEKTKQADDRKTLLNIISALKTTLIDKQVFSNQAEIIEYLANEFDSRGLSESNLKAKFADVNKQEKSN